MPSIQFPSKDGKALLTALVEESEDGSCSLRDCQRRVLEQPKGPPKPSQSFQDQRANLPPEPPRKKITGDEKPSGKFTLAKANKFLRAWVLMMKQGTVSEEVYKYRRGICEGVEGVSLPCPHLASAGDGEMYCNQCGCGNRQYATLFIKGKPDNETERLWMPDPQCPTMAIRPFKGIGSLKAVGGRMKQVKRLMMAAKNELKKNKLAKDEGEEFLADLEGITNGNADMA